MIKQNHHLEIGQGKPTEEKDPQEKYKNQIVTHSHFQESKH